MRRDLRHRIWSGLLALAVVIAAALALQAQSGGQAAGLARIDQASAQEMQHAAVAAECHATGTCSAAILASPLTAVFAHNGATGMVMA